MITTVRVYLYNSHHVHVFSSSNHSLSPSNPPFPSSNLHLPPAMSPRALDPSPPPCAPIPPHDLEISYTCSAHPLNRPSVARIQYADFQRNPRKTLQLLECPVPTCEHRNVRMRHRELYWVCWSCGKLNRPPIKERCDRCLYRRDSACRMEWVGELR